MDAKLFYSWQNTLPSKYNRSFIESCIKTSIKRANKLEPLKSNFDHQKHKWLLDQATRETQGSPDIAITIFDKIQSTSLFVADVSIIKKVDNRSFPNSNVIAELGFAAACIGWENTIMIMNVSTDSPEYLPFDLRGRRVLTYHLDNKTSGNDKRNTKENLCKTMVTIINDRSKRLNLIKNDPYVTIILFISNRISILKKYWHQLIIEIYKCSNIKFEERNFDWEEFKEICSKANERNEINVSTPFGIQKKITDWYHAVHNITKKTLLEIFIFHDKIDTLVLDPLIKAEAQLNILSLGTSAGHITRDLNFYAYDIFQVFNQLSYSIEIHQKMHNQHLIEYHLRYRRLAKDRIRKES